MVLVENEIVKTMVNNEREGLATIVLMVLRSREVNSR